VDETEKRMLSIGVITKSSSCISVVPSSCQVTLIFPGLKPDVEHVAIGAAGSPSIVVVRSVTVGLAGRSVWKKHVEYVYMKL